MRGKVSILGQIGGILWQKAGLVIHVLDPIIFYSQRSYLYILSTAARELVEGSLEDEEPVQIDEHEVVDGGAEETDHQAGHNLAVGSWLQVTMLLWFHHGGVDVLVKTLFWT